MNNRVVTIVWVAGLTLAVLVYALGPDDALASLFRLSDEIGAALQHLLVTLGGRAFDVLRALAIGCFVVFAALSVVASGRGLPGRWLLLVVTALFLALVWHEGPEATGHWMLAFILSASAALNVTRKLALPSHPPGTPNRGPALGPSDPPPGGAPVWTQRRPPR